MMTAYYNENDPKAAAWLRGLIERGLIAQGDVDERSIADVQADDLRGYAQCHFFAGIGGWSLALRQAGWPDERPVWTGSCPCQPFSVSGAGKGYADDRHLAPIWLGRIAERRPPTIFGEQVASKDARAWLSVVRSEMEKLGYVVGAADLCAAGVGAPHIRQRLWFGASGVGDCFEPTRERDARGVFGAQAEVDREGFVDGRNTVRPEHAGASVGRVAHGGCQGSAQQFGGRDEPARPSAPSLVGELGDCRGEGLEKRKRDGRIQPETLGPCAGQATVSRGGAGGLAHSPSPDATPEREQRGGQLGQQSHDGGVEFVADSDRAGSTENTGNTGEVSSVSEAQREPEHSPALPGGSGGNVWPGADHGGWDVADWLHCRDGKWRPVEPGTFPLDHGIPARLGRLRGYGNAIVPQVAAEFIEAYLEAYLETRTEGNQAHDH